MTTQLLEMNAAQGRAEAVRKYFTRTPNQPTYLPAILLALNAVGFFLITLWIVIASRGQSQQTPSPQPAPQQTVQPQPPPSSEPQPRRRGKSGRPQAEQQPTTQSTTTQSTTTQTASVQPPQNPAIAQATGCAGCASTVTGVIAVISALLAAWFYFLRKKDYVRAWHNAEPKPSDAQIDEWRNGDFERLEKRDALEKLDLITDQVAAREPLRVVGAGPSPQFRRGKDGRIRFSSHEVLIIYLTDYHLAAFKCVIDLHDGGIRTETTQEYHYDDVVSVSTQAHNSTLIWYEEGQPKQIPTHQRFAISVASGEQISVAVAGEPLGSESDPELKRAKYAIQTIRTKLRGRKGGSPDTGPIA
jgi:hypothetical protein